MNIVKDLELSDEDILRVIQSKYEYHMSYANKYSAMINAYKATDTNKRESLQSLTSLSKTEESISEENANMDSKLLTHPVKTFEENVLDILSDGMPRLVKDLSEDYFKEFGRKFPHKEFSSKLSTRQKTGKNIKSYIIKHYPLEMRYWWGKYDWFVGEELKEEYKYKIQERTNITINQISNQEIN